ncbi:MAG: hypothetical protein Fur0022_15080 [Anaerolineales bacterium]
MKTQNNFYFSILILFLLLLLTSCAFSPMQKNTPVNDESRTVYYEPSYITLDRAEMITNADVILVGEVKSISPTQWNQDSGEYWEDVYEGVTDVGEKLNTSFSAWPVHFIQLSVQERIVDEIGVGKELTLTVLGKSPLIGTGSEQADGITVEGEAGTPGTLKVGDRIIVFVVQTELAWRDPNQPIKFLTNEDGATYFDYGKRVIFDFISMPANSYLVDGKDGLYYSVPEATIQEEPLSLDQFILKVSEKRETLVVP